MMRTLRKRVHTPVSLSPAIKEAIADEIAAPPRKRDRLSPLLVPSSPPPSPLPSPLPSPSRKRSRSSLPPLPPLPSSPPSDMLLLRKRVRMTPLQTETSEEIVNETHTETTAPTRLFHHIVSLVVARLISHERLIDEIHKHLREVSLERIKTLEQEVETMRDRAEITEQRTEDLQDALWRARDEIVEHQVCHEDTEARLQQSEASVIELKAHIRRLEDRFGM
ncbi:hypothetical protein Tco_1186754 [Tanacetum coccineum]